MRDWYRKLQILAAAAIAAALVGVYVFARRENKKTPVPPECENLKPDCKACGIADCAMRKELEEGGKDR